MKKIIFGIFAHPDDEAFGPCGTLLQETRSGSELHLIMLTAGEAGMNPKNSPNLSSIRIEEWRKAGELLGAKQMHHLGYSDGTLNNTSMIEIATKIQTIVSNTLVNSSKDIMVEFIGFDLTGLSGHIDHIVATRAAFLAFYRLKEADPRLARIRLFCLPEALFPKHQTAWLYAEKGRSNDEIDETIDARSFRDDIIEVMRTHKTQKSDCDKLLDIYGEQLGLNYFIVKT